MNSMNNILPVKKYLLFAAYVVLNLGLSSSLVMLNYGYMIAALFVIGGHIRNFLGVLYQLVNFRRILKKCPDIVPDDGQRAAATTVCCLVPVYNEDPVMLKKNLDGLTSQEVSEGIKVLVVLLFDGVGNHNVALFDSVVELVEDFQFSIGEQRWYQNWKSKEDMKLAYNVGRYNDTTIILSYKENNSGKKDSLIIGEKFITTAIPEIESIGVPSVDFIYHTDGDTVSDKHCLNEMLMSLKDDPNLDGVSGLLRTFGRENASCTEQGFVVMQDFQYFFSLIVRRMAESLMNSTTCLPGCCNMIRVSPRTNLVIEKYANLPANESSLVQTVTRMQGTDRRYTTLLLKQGSKLQMNWRAFVHTEPPLSAESFINQRRRWSSNSFFNSLVLMYCSNIPLYIRVSTLFDISRVFCTPFRFISYLCFWVFVRELSTANFVVFGVLIMLPYLYTFSWMFFIVPEWKQMMIGFFLNKIFMPFLSIISVTKMFLTSTNFAWGTTYTNAEIEQSPSTMLPPGPVSSPSHLVSCVTDEDQRVDKILSSPDSKCSSLPWKKKTEWSSIFYASGSRCDIEQ